jgi:hypothetical protein
MANNIRRSETDKSNAIGMLIQARTFFHMTRSYDALTSSFALLPAPSLSSCAPWPTPRS